MNKNKRNIAVLILKKGIKWIPVLIFLINACFVFLSSSDKVSDTWMWVAALYLFAAAAITFWFQNGISPNKKMIISSIILSIILVLMLSIKDIVKHPISTNTFLESELIVFLIISSFLVVYKILEWFISVANDNSVNSFIWLKILVVVEGLLFLFANYPFRPSADALDVYLSAMIRNWYDWHTISFELYVAACMKLGGLFGWYHPFVACIVQTVIWYIALFRLGNIINIIFGDRAERSWFIINVFMYIPMMYLGVMYKDVLFSMCLMAFCGELLHILSIKEISKLNVIFMAIFGTGAALFRHGMFVVVAISTVVAGVYFFNHKKEDNKYLKRIICMAGILFFVLGSYIFMHIVGDKILGMTKNPSYVKYSVPLYVCANIASEHPELIEVDDLELLEEIAPIETWRNAYESDKYWADTISRPWGIVGDSITKVDNTYGKKLLVLNAKFLVRNPKVYIDSVTKVTSIIWQIARPADGYEWSSAGYYWRKDYPEEDPNLYSMDSGIKKLLENLEVGMWNTPLVSSVYYRGGIWVFIIMIVWAVLIMKGKKELLIAMLSPMIVFLLMMLSCPAQDPRFALSFMETGMLGLVVARYSNSKKINN